MLWLYLLMALLAGAMLPLQAGVNSQLARWTNQTVIAGLISFFVGTLAMIAATVVLRPAWPSVGHLAQAPWWSWLGGLLGAYFIAAAIIVVPKLGAALFVAIVVAGQTLVAIILDHYGLLGYAVRPLGAWRIVGVALLLAGVWLIRRY
ncbi:MAG: DMT family transporter [Pyrinomonadaceae bacterium]